MSEEKKDGSGFRVVGLVHRRSVVASGKVAFLTVTYPRGTAYRKADMRAFDDSLIVEVGALKENERVEVRGELDMEQPKNSDKSPVRKNDRDFWCPSLVITSLVRLAPPPPPPKEIHGDDDVDF
jgi:hypothetical protein